MVLGRIDVTEACVLVASMSKGHEVAIIGPSGGYGPGFVGRIWFRIGFVQVSNWFLLASPAAKRDREGRLGSIAIKLTMGVTEDPV